MKLDDWTREELAAAAKNVRDRRFAEMVVFVLGLAAESHPEELRKAFAEVFDLSAWERQAAEISASYTRLCIDVVEKQSELTILKDRVKAQDKQIADLQSAVEIMSETIGKIRVWAAQTNSKPIK